MVEVVSFWFTATHSTGSGTRVAVTIMLILMNLLYIANFHTQALCTSPEPDLALEAIGVKKRLAHARVCWLAKLSVYDTIGKLRPPGGYDLG